MELPRPFALVRTADQWLRSVHDHTSLELASGVVALAWEMPETADNPGTLPVAGGLAFDNECRLYHSVPTEGRIERLLWAAPPSEQALEQLFPDASPPAPAGDFHCPQAAAIPSLQTPTALAVDGSDRLFIAETGAHRLLIYDLWDRRLLRKLQLSSTAAAGPRPIDLAVQGERVFVLLDQPSSLVSLEARRDPVPETSPVALDGAVRLASRPGGAPGVASLFVIVRAADGIDAQVVPLDPSLPTLHVPRATDLDFDGDGALVVARHPGEDFLRFHVSPGTVEDAPPLKARGYDGRGIVRNPDGRIGYWSPYGFRVAVAARLVYQPSGRVTTFRLDSGQYQTRWGRLFLDACVPEGTELRVRSVTVDEPPPGGAVMPSLPSNVPVATIRRPDLTPPLLPQAFASDPVANHLHRRETGRELPWSRLDAADRFETWEAPILAGPGRFLWVTVELRGDTARTPRLRSLRAEHPSHDWLQRLPKTFSRDAVAESFLRRYLAIFDGTLGELEAKAVQRLALLDPRSTPPELLPWLAGFLGLILDERFATATRRRLIAEAIDLFRLRGTIHGLGRFLEIYLGAPVNFVEHFRLRGIGGTVLGQTAVGSDTPTSAVVGSSFRIGGAIGVGDLRDTLVTDAAAAFRSHAHRFTVLIAAALTAEQRAVVQTILDVHRPAHTIVDFCTVDAGIRVGLGLLVGLSSVIGRTGKFATAQIGQWALGRGAVVGRPVAGTVLDASRLGKDSRVR